MVSSRDSGPQHPTINERVVSSPRNLPLLLVPRSSLTVCLWCQAQSARFRSDRRHGIFQSQLDRFRTERGLRDEL